MFLSLSKVSVFFPLLALQLNGAFLHSSAALSVLGFMQSLSWCTISNAVKAAVAQWWMLSALFFAVGTLAMGWVVNKLMETIEIWTICSGLGSHCPPRCIISWFGLPRGCLVFVHFNRNSLQKHNVRCDFSDVVYFTAVLYRFLKDLCLFFCNKVLCNNGLLAEGTESLRITATSASCQTHEGTLRAGRSDESSAAVALPFPLQSVAIWAECTASHKGWSDLKFLQVPSFPQFFSNWGSAAVAYSALTCRNPRGLATNPTRPSSATRFLFGFTSREPRRG